MTEPMELDPFTPVWQHVPHFSQVEAKSRLARLVHLDSMDPPHVDIDRLQRVWEVIETNLLDDAIYLTDGRADQRVMLDGWNQTKWRTAAMVGERCQTAMCLAGWTTHLDAIERGQVGGGWVVDQQLLEARARWNVEAAKLPALDPHYDDSIEDADRFLALALAGDVTEGLVPRDDDPPNDVEVEPIHIPARLLPRDTDGLPIGRTVHRVRYVPVRRRAKRLLGLTERETGDLFHQDNTLAMLRNKIHATIAAERIRRRRREEIARLRNQLANPPAQQG